MSLYMYVRLVIYAAVFFTRVSFHAVNCTFLHETRKYDSPKIFLKVTTIKEFIILLLSISLDYSAMAKYKICATWHVENLAKDKF